MGLFDRFKSSAPQEQPSSAVPNTEDAFTPLNPVPYVQTGAPATSRTVVLSKGGVDLAKRFDKVGIALGEMDGVQAEAGLILDHSGSMAGLYSNGAVQRAVDRALAFSLRIDPDGQIPVVPFDSQVWDTVPVNLDNYAGVVDRDIYKPYAMGGTILAPAMDRLIEMAETTKVPMFGVIVTDDDPQDRAMVLARLRYSKRLPIFWKVLVLVEDTPWWDARDSNTDDPHLVDNLNVARVTDIETISDLDFARKMTSEWADWVTRAKTAGILL